MNADRVIREIDSLTEQDQAEVIAHVRQLEESRYHREQVKIAVQRLQDLDDGLEEEVPLDEAMKLFRSHATSDGSLLPQARDCRSIA